MPRRFKPHHSSVVVPHQQRLLWHLSSAILECLLVVAFLLTVFLLMIFASGGLKHNSFFPLQRVRIEQTLQFGNIDDIKDIIRRYAKKDLLHIDTGLLATEMKHLSWVKNAKISKHWPNILEISIKERIPVVRWGKQDFLDREGNRFTVPMTQFLQDELFPLQGPDGYETRVLDIYQKIAPWFVQENLSVEALILDPRLVWHLRLAGDIDVIIGREHLEERLKKLIIVNKKVIKPYRDYVDTVDLRYQNGFSVRWKPGVESPGIKK